jgi:hypothetical protein
MEIKTQITQADLIEFQLFHSLRSVGSRLRFFSLAILPALVPSAALYAITAGHLSRPVRLSFLLTVPLYFGLFYFLARRRVAKNLERSLNSKQTNAELGDHVIDVEEQGIRLNQGAKDRFLNWKDIKRVIVNSGYGYIYTSADRAIIVPERSFTDGNAFALFMKVAVIYHWNAQRAETEQTKPVAAPEKATTQHTGTSPMPTLESQAPIAFVSRG